MNFEEQDVAVAEYRTGSFLNQNESTDSKTDLKILVVNDEIMSQIIIRTILEKSIKIPSENIKTAENGK